MDVMGWMMGRDRRRGDGLRKQERDRSLSRIHDDAFLNGALGHLLYDESSFPTELRGEKAP